MGVNIGGKKPELKSKYLDTRDPFNKGVSYDAFLSNVKGGVTLPSLLKRLSLSKEQEEWIKLELDNHKNNKK